MGVVAVGTSEGKCTMMEGESKWVKDTRLLECVMLLWKFRSSSSGQSCGDKAALMELTLIFYQLHFNFQIWIEK